VRRRRSGSRIRAAATPEGAVESQREVVDAFFAAARNGDFDALVVNGGAGVLATLQGRPFSLMAFTVSGGRIVEIDAIADPDRVRTLIDAYSAQRT
jgi:RNA polymerase sigma-70 factor (ECF subfamily)